ncbi:hypothetical protein BAUCODRAFT_238538 [Baudoinia panamericana UAMH 10762]|uniref:Uncharacterized protein n=1 Tax=Baudoinia panamericana (strain UAMH 10762) TaxID=717646 RepID=M2N3S4_BAUPA|nr:uncharacterized protein BAUCODRAFT_238538 [Baudoinia panamericana UAMH 10762]EMC93370.1 hypothetical protein BAUCODRAFT_238538 [Baudoinia panamericana UAMH 10762]
MYPFRAMQKEMALSAVVEPHILEIVYPPERRKALNIVINTNTAPAEPEEPSAEEPDVASGKQSPSDGEDTLFPYDMPEAAERAEDKLERVLASLVKRPRSRSVLKVQSAPRGGWHRFHSVTRAEQPQPVWAPATTVLFQSHSDSVHPRRQWWQDDLEQRRAQLDEGVDYCITRPTSKAFISDWDDMWWKEDVGGAFEVDTPKLMELKQAKEQYIVQVEAARSFYKHYAGLQLQSRHHPGVAEVQDELRDIARIKRKVKTRLMAAQQWLMDKAEAAGEGVPPEALHVSEQLERELFEPANGRPQQDAGNLKPPAAALVPKTQKQMVDTPVSPHSLAGEAWRCTYPALSDSRPVSEAASSENTTSLIDERETTPFPVYEDPMLRRTEDLAATQQDISKPLERPRSRRRNTSRDLVAQLEYCKTGPIDTALALHSMGSLPAMSGDT